MRIANDLILLLGFWGEKITRPTIRNLLKDFFEYEYESSVRSAVSRFLGKKYIRKIKRGGELYFQITQAGKSYIMLNEGVAELRNYKWDGRWRIVSFDIPEEDRKTRRMLVSYLRSRNFGPLQESLWVSARDELDVVEYYVKSNELGNFIALLEAPDILNLSGRDVVDGAWNFKKINEAYKIYIEEWKDALERLKKGEGVKKKQLFEVAKEELNDYNEAVFLDPLLPSSLVPDHFMGKMADEIHIEFLKILRTKFAEKTRA